MFWQPVHTHFRFLALNVVPLNIVLIIAMRGPNSFFTAFYWPSSSYLRIQSYSVQQKSYDSVQSVVLFDILSSHDWRSRYPLTIHFTKICFTGRPLKHCSHRIFDIGKIQRHAPRKMTCSYWDIGESEMLMRDKTPWHRIMGGCRKAYAVLMND